MERRDLQGLTVPTGHGVAHVPKGGLLTLSGMMEVRFEYMGQMQSVMVQPQADAEEVAKVIEQRCQEIDDAEAQTDIRAAVRQHLEASIDRMVDAVFNAIESGLPVQEAVGKVVVPVVAEAAEAVRDKLPAAEPERGEKWCL